MRESQLAQYLVDWLIEDGWEVYKEVCLGKWSDSAPRADIVAKRNNIIWVIETKQNMTLALLDQALRIYRYYPAHYVSVAIWEPKSKQYHHNAAKEFLQYLGIGLFYVSEFGGINCNISPNLRRKMVNLRRWSDYLHEEQKAVKAGTRNEWYWTPFKSTVSRIHIFLKENPGSTLNEIINGIEHHYNCNNTAKNAISEYIRRGIIKKIRVDRTTKPFRYYLDSEGK